MKQVAHGVDKNRARPFPLQRQIKSLRPQLEVEALFKRMTRHSSEPFSKGLGVAMLAAGADLGAACDGIPGGVGPLDI